MNALELADELEKDNSELKLKNENDFFKSILNDVELLKKDKEK